MISESLLEFCESEPQRRAIQARIDTNTVKEAADLIGISVRNVQVNIANVKKNAARRGWSPEHDMTRTVPDGLSLKVFLRYTAMTDKSKFSGLRVIWHTRTS